MRLLHYLEIQNFKRFGDRQRIELDHPAVLIGPNDCGKTTALQAIALWSQAVATWHGNKGQAPPRKRTSTSLNRLGIVSAPVQRTRYFWHNTHVRTGNRDIPLLVTVGVLHEGRVEPVTMRFRNQGDDLVYCTPDERTLQHPDLIAAAARMKVRLLTLRAGASDCGPGHGPGHPAGAGTPPVPSRGGMLGRAGQRLLRAGQLSAARSRRRARARGGRLRGDAAGALLRHARDGAGPRRARDARQRRATATGGRRRRSPDHLVESLRGGDYFVTPDVLKEFVRRACADDPPRLERIEAREADEALDALILERVFPDRARDFATWQGLDADAARLVWESSTGAVKLSDFAEEFFRRLADRLGRPMLLRKGELHRPRASPALRPPSPCAASWGPAPRGGPARHATRPRPTGRPAREVPWGSESHGSSRSG